MIGTQLGAYRVLQQIGEGGMGSVWLAEHAMLGRRAAIKVLHPSFTSRQDIVTRFFNEARAATAISDPGIVQVFDFGHHTDGSAYIVMELLDGEPLDKRLRRLGTLPIADALRIMRQVAGSLGAAHVRGIVHRDLKPENIYLVRDPEVAGGERAKILDFGIAKLGGDMAAKTNTSAVMGTPTYMSPEQCRGAGGVDQRSDVYALGCVMFTLITGRPPFDAEGIGDIIAMHLREPAPLMSSRVGGIPPELDHLVLTCMAKDPAHRFASAAALGGAIGALSATLGFGGTGGFGAAPPGSLATTHTTLSGASGASIAGAGTGVPAKRSRTGLVIGLTLVVLVGGGITAAALSGGGGDHATPASAPTVAAAPTSPPPAPVVAAPAPAPAAAPVVAPDPRVAVAASMKQLLAGFTTWAQTHPGAPCPDAATLGAAPDPWGHPLLLTCTDQPKFQIAGAISSGPDGVPGNDDDLDSWEFADVAATVHGPRWVVAAPKAASAPHTIAHVAPAPVVADPPPPRPRPAPPAEVKPDPPKPKPAVELDANGMPIHR